MTPPITNISDLDLLLEVVREEKLNLAGKSETTGQAIHGLIVEVLGQMITLAMRKRLERESGQ